jgi:hypothetical protein
MKKLILFLALLLIPSICHAGYQTDTLNVTGNATADTLYTTGTGSSEFNEAPHMWDGLTAGSTDQLTIDTDGNITTSATGLFGTTNTFEAGDSAGGGSFTALGTGIINSGDLWLTDTAHVFFGKNISNLTRWQVGGNIGFDITANTADAGEITLYPTSKVILTGNLDASGTGDFGTLTVGSGSITDSSGAISFGNENLSTTGTLSAGAITGTSFIIGANTLSTEFAYLDGIGAYVYRASGTDVPVADGGTGLSTIASGSILAANSANTLSAITSTSATKVLTNTSGTVSWETASGGVALSDNNTWTGTNLFNNTVTLGSTYTQKSMEVDFTAVWEYNVTESLGWIDDTTEAGSSSGTPFNTMGSTGDYIYIGYSAKFAGFAIDIAVGTDGEVSVYQYWDGDSWETIPYKVNTIPQHWNGDGYMLWNADDLTGWATATPAGAGMPASAPDATSRFWIRVVSGEGEPYSTCNQIAVIPNYYIADYYPHSLATTPSMRIPTDGSMEISSLTCPTYDTASGGYSFDTGSTVGDSTDLVAFKNNASPKLKVKGNGDMYVYGDILPADQTLVYFETVNYTRAIIMLATEDATGTTQWGPVYIDSDGESRKADSDSTSTMPAIGLKIGDSGLGSDYIVTHGNVYKASWGLTKGAVYYVSGTAGGLTTTAPTGSGKVVQAIGIATSANNLYVNPSYNNVALP